MNKECCDFTLLLASGFVAGLIVGFLAGVIYG